MAEIIDGKALGAEIRNELAYRVSRLEHEDMRPGLAVVCVGDNPASRIYIKNKVKACEEAGMFSEQCIMSENATESEVLRTVSALNNRDDIHGILVQLPLPAHINPGIVIEAIDPEKDVDGFHPENLGNLVAGLPSIIPCTPLGIMRMLQTNDVEFRGKKAVVIGASPVVGKPMALLMVQAGATVTMCNSKTSDLAAETKTADIVVVCAGKPKLVTGDMIKPGATVVDVGINRLEDGKIVGDVDFASVEPVAGKITPVPGGVGPMTIAMLLSNTLDAAERYFERRKA